MGGTELAADLERVEIVGSGLAGFYGGFVDLEAVFVWAEIHCGIEQIVDQLAGRIGMDPVQFRRRNCVKTGDTILTGMKMPAIDLGACIDKVTEAIKWDEGRRGAARLRPSAPHKKRGKGIAIMWKAPAMPPNPGSSAIVRFNEDATVNVEIGAQELGQAAFTVAAQIAAQALGVPYEWVRVSAPVDTRYSPYEWQTVASRITWSTGNAVKAAAEDARRQILDVVAQHWDEDPDDLDIKEGKVISYLSEREQPLQNMVVYGLPNENFEGWKGGPIVGQGKFMPTYVTNLDFETGQGTRAVVHYTVGAQAVDLEVDTETGQIEILKIASAYDVGKAINPDLVLTQIEGGAVQGASSAFEALQFDEKGQPLNANLVDYRIATSVDAPGEIHGPGRRRARDGSDGPGHCQRHPRRGRHPLQRPAAVGGKDLPGLAGARRDLGGLTVTSGALADRAPDFS